MTDEEFSDWVSSQLVTVESRLRESVHTPYAFVEEAASYLMELGGKRFRPGLVLAASGLAAASGDRDENAVISAAVVVELTHVASLYHDDVMDEAELRRGAPTAHKRWSNSVAIMVGDFLLAQASQIGALLGQDFMVFQAQTLARLVQGQIGEMRAPATPAEAINHHLDVVSNKTAALIAASARFGGMFAGLDDDRIEALTQYGERLGVAFQLADDVLDIISDRSGKQPGTDLREGVPTLVPLLVREHARSQDERLIELLAAPVTEPDIPEALRLLRAHPALDEARSQIRAWASEAVELLAPFPDSAAKRALTLLCEQAVVRTA
jgi:heptaprenyl diphosphate synthase